MAVVGICTLIIKYDESYSFKVTYAIIPVVFRTQIKMHTCVIEKSTYIFDLENQ